MIIIKSLIVLTIIGSFLTSVDKIEFHYSSENVTRLFSAKLESCNQSLSLYKSPDTNKWDFLQVHMQDCNEEIAKMLLGQLFNRHSGELPVAEIHTIRMNINNSKLLSLENSRHEWPKNIEQLDDLPVGGSRWFLHEFLTKSGYMRFPVHFLEVIGCKTELKSPGSYTENIWKYSVQELQEKTLLPNQRFSKEIYFIPEWIDLNAKCR